MSQPATNGPDPALQGAGEYYEIRLKSHLDGCWAERFGDVTLCHTENGETVLAAFFPDQAALFGVLLQIHGLGLELLSVHRGSALPSVPEDLAERG